MQRSDDTSHGVRSPSGEINSGDRCAGFPCQHHPLSGFLTLSAVYSHLSLAALFRAASAHRISAFRALLHSVSCTTSRWPVLSCRQPASTDSEYPRRWPSPPPCLPPLSPPRSSRSAVSLLLALHEMPPTSSRHAAIKITGSGRVAKDAPKSIRKASSTTIPARTERQLKQPLRQARTPTSEPYSNRAAVLPARVVNTRRSRCSPGLLPLRGIPALPPGRSPPLLRLPRAGTRRRAPSAGQPEPKLQMANLWPTSGS